MPRLPTGGADGGGLQGRGGSGHSAKLQSFAAGGAAPVGFQRGGDGRAIRAIFPREEIEEALRDGLEGDLVRTPQRGVEPVAEAEERRECGVWSAECGVFRGLAHSAFRTPHFHKSGSVSVNWPLFATMSQ